MNPPADETTVNAVLKYGGMALGALASGIATVGGWLFHRVIQKHDNEIAAINGGIANLSAKLDDKVDRDVWEQNRREARDNTIALHRKIEQIGRDAEERHRDLMNILLQRREQKREGDV